MNKLVKEESERIAKEATRQAMLDPLMPYYITVAPFIEAAILQARSQAFEEATKIVDGYNDAMAIAGENGEMLPIAPFISQAIRQHSQKGRDT